MNAKHEAVATLPPSDDDEDAILSVLLAIEDGTLPASRRDAGRLTGYLTHARKPVRRRACGALATAIRSGAIAAEDCEVLLASSDATERWGAAFALSRAGHTTDAVVEVALATLESADGDVRWAAASIVIAAARESEPLRTRLRILVTEGSATKRKMALLCLADGGEREIPICLRALHDDDALVRLAALTTIGRIAAATPAVVAAVTAVADADTEATVRRAATAILRRLGADDSTRST